MCTAATWADLIADAVRQRLLAHSLTRAPICMRSIADGRQQLRAMLRILEAETQARHSGYSGYSGYSCDAVHPRETETQTRLTTTWR